MSRLLPTLLVATAVLLWPGWRRPARATAPVGWTQRASPAFSGAATGTRTDPGAQAGPDGGGRPAAQATSMEVAAAVDLLVLALRAGIGVVEAVEAVGRLVLGPAGRDLCRVAAAHRWGFEPRAAWGAASAAWRPVSTAMAMAASGGVPPVTLLELTAQELRAAERARVEQATAALGVRLVIPLGVAFLPAFVLTSVVPVVLALAGNVLGGS